MIGIGGMIGGGMMGRGPKGVKSLRRANGAPRANRGPKIGKTVNGPRTAAPRAKGAKRVDKIVPRIWEMLILF